jgi:hypothetical protein
MPAPGANREPVLRFHLIAHGLPNQVTSCSAPVAHSGTAQGRTI